MYVRMFDDLERNEGDNPTNGILLCTETDRPIAKYSVLSESQQLFASKNLPYLPTEEELAAEIEPEKNIARTGCDTWREEVDLMRQMSAKKLIQFRALTGGNFTKT